MPKVPLTFAERERTKFERDRDKQINYLLGVFSSTKYYIPEHEITSQIKKGSKAIVNKVRKTPEKATVLQLFEVAHAIGKKVTITIE